MSGLRGWGVIFDLAKKKSRLEEIEQEAASPDFWNDNEKAQQVLKERADISAIFERAGNLQANLADLEALYELFLEDQSDTEITSELMRESRRVDAELANFELERMLSGPHDADNAILEINSGAGGTDAQDWGDILLRMYLRWAERRGFKANVFDMSYGEKVGIKSATVAIEGRNAFGYLRSERGVHRLVRISPFDQNAKRHTSFASVSVMPDIEQEVEIEINEEELRVDTYRASGAGGQHINKTDSAVRLTHLSSGIVVACQSSRSQHKNKEQALRLLKAKLYEKEMERKQEELNKLAGERKKIDFGSQIRNYVMQPYQLVKDLRTDFETGNVQAVLDGEIDDFIESYLLSDEHNRTI